MTSKFSPEARGSVLQGLYGGLTLSESIERAGLAEQTVKNWLNRGRKDLSRSVESEHATFAVAVDEARDVASAAEMTLEEFRGHLNRAVRNGSVAAMKLWMDVRPDLDEDEVDDPFARFAESDQLDRLNARRATRLAAQRPRDPFAEGTP